MKNIRGTIAMARTNDPNSATSEFFLNTQDNRSILDPQPGSAGYAAFGTISAGMSSTVGSRSTLRNCPPIRRPAGSDPGCERMRGT